MAISCDTMLPREQWEQILVNIPAKDLCKVVLTSSYMYDMASWPNLWTDTKVNISKLKKEGLANLYSINRFKNIRKLNFNGMAFRREEMERVLHEIPETPLEHLDLSYVNLSQVCAGLLATAVSSLKTVNLSRTHLTTDQCIQLFEACAVSNTLTKISLQNVNIKNVPTELMTRTISNLEITNLWGAKLTSDQFVKALTTSQSCKKVVKVHPAGLDLPELQGDQSLEVLRVMFNHPVHGCFTME